MKRVTVHGYGREWLRDFNIQEDLNIRRGRSSSDPFDGVMKVKKKKDKNNELCNSSNRYSNSNL